MKSCHKLLKQFPAFFLAMIFILVAGNLRAEELSQYEITPGEQAAIDKGKAAAQQKDYLGAISDFMEALRHAPGDPKVDYFLGLAESNIPGRELRAICWFKLYLAENSKAANAAAVENKITALNSQSRENAANMIKTLQGFLANLSNDSENYVNFRWGEIASYWLNIGDVKDALKTCDFSNNTNPVFSLQEVVIYQSAQGDVEGAEKTYQLFDHYKSSKAAEGYFRTTSLEAIADALAKAGKVKEAKDTLMKAQSMSESIVSTNLNEKIEEQSTIRKALDNLNSLLTPTVTPATPETLVTSVEWIDTLYEQTNGYNNYCGGLSCGLFLDFASTLKSLPANDGTSHYYEAFRLLILSYTTEQTKIEAMLKRKTDIIR